jgi:hypothetical protein
MLKNGRRSFLARASLATTFYAVGHTFCGYEVQLRQFLVISQTLLADAPYIYTQEDVLFQTYVRHKETPPKELEARGVAASRLLAPDFGTGTPLSTMKAPSILRRKSNQDYSKIF